MMKSIEEIKADYHLFIDIQMGKYLKNVNKSEFSNDSEAKLVLDKIVEAYNQKVASDHLRLDNLNNAAKTAWFNSIELDFRKEVTKAISEFEAVFENEFEKVTEHFYDIFPFLPDGSMEVLIFVGPALEAYGLPFERFKDLILGEPPTEIEEDIITWAFEVTFNVMGSLVERGKAKRKKILDDAIKIAGEELDKETAINVVQEICNAITETIGKEPKKSRKKKNSK